MKSIRKSPSRTLTVCQLFKIHSALYRTKMSIALLTRARHVSITWAKCMQRISHPTYVMRVLISILSFYLCLCVASAIFLLGFLTKILCTYSLLVYFNVTALLTNLQLITICRIISSSSRPVFAFRTTLTLFLKLEYHPFSLVVRKTQRSLGQQGPAYNWTGVARQAEENCQENEISGWF
jgi:hypothetical protein